MPRSRAAGSGHGGGQTSGFQAEVQALVQATRPPGPRDEAWPGGSAPVLQAEGLCWWQAGVLMLDRLSFSLRPGELLVVRGQAWSALRALLLMLAGWSEPHAGRVTLGGQPLSDWRLADLGADLALVAWLAEPPLPCTVADLLALGLDRPGPAPQPLGGPGGPDRVPWALQRLGLLPWAASPCTALAPELLQRALIGRVLVQGSRFLLLDEPAQGLDDGARARLHLLLQGLADDGLAVLMTSRAPAAVQLVADRALWLPPAADPAPRMSGQDTAAPSPCEGEPP